MVMLTVGSLRSLPPSGGEYMWRYIDMFSSSPQEAETWSIMGGAGDDDDGSAGAPEAVHPAAPRAGEGGDVRLRKVFRFGGAGEVGLARLGVFFDLRQDFRKDLIRAFVRRGFLRFGAGF